MAISTERLRLKYTTAVEQVRESKKELKMARTRCRWVVVAQQVVQAVAQDVQQKAHDQIARVVTRCLRTVFADEKPPHEFRINFVRKRGRTDAVLTFKKGKLELDPLDGGGHGPVDVAALALRLACLLLSRPRRQRVLVLDEPFRAIHGVRNRRRAADLVEALAEEMKVQFVIVTGLKWLQVGKVIGLD